MPHSNDTTSSTQKSPTLPPLRHSLKLWKLPAIRPPLNLSALTQQHFADAISCFETYKTTPLALSLPLVDMKKFWLEMGYNHLYLAANIPYRQEHLLLDPKKAPQIIDSILSYGHGRALCDIAVLHYDFAHDENVVSSKENKEQHLQIALKLLAIIEEKYSKEQKVLPQDIQKILVEWASSELATLSR